VTTPEYLLERIKAGKIQFSPRLPHERKGTSL
jgi:hypothetical protein